MFPVNAFQNTVGKAAAIFGRLGIRFHLTGGLTSVLYGEPRMTQDIDIVVDNQAMSDQLDLFVYRSSSEADRQRIHELAQRLSLATLLDEVLNAADEIA